ncbi:MAG TPA: helix-turn-helix transcriptional regulator [Chitinophagaceae bacterium]|nr:helix-turn-helix transcriptional regulator [Chitinophagaceae bacterium]
MQAKNCSPSSVEIGNTIRKLRILKDYKQQEFAALIEICPEALSKIENGKTDISLSRLCSIADALSVDIKILFSDPAELFK